jgi:hypothetical protein
MNCEGVNLTSGCYMVRDATCLPRALKIPAVIAEFPSTTWKSARSGMTEATRVTTSVTTAVVRIKRYGGMASGFTGIIVEHVRPGVSEGKVYCARPRIKEGEKYENCRTNLEKHDIIKAIKMEV